MIEDAGDVVRINKKRHLTSAEASVTETLPKETNQAMVSSLFPRAHNESPGDQPSDCGQKRLKGGPASFHLHTVHLKQISRKKTIVSTQKDKAIASFPFSPKNKTRSEAEPPFVGLTIAGFF